MALSVPPSRFTSLVGGGSAFYVRRHNAYASKHDFDMKHKLLAVLCGAAIFSAGCATSHTDHTIANASPNDVMEARELQTGLPAYLGLPSERIQIVADSGVIYIVILGVSSPSERQAITAKIHEAQKQNPKADLIKLQFRA